MSALVLSAEECYGQCQSLASGLIFLGCFVALMLVTWLAARNIDR